MGILIILFIFVVAVAISCLIAASKKYDNDDKFSAIYWAALGGFWINIALDIFKAFFKK
jgi:hypothetical protein